MIRRSVQGLISGFGKRCFPLIALIAAGCSEPLSTPLHKGQMAQLQIPEGFQVEVFAENVPNARSLAMGEKGTVFVGSRKAGNVYALQDLDGDHKAEKVIVLTEGLNEPNGLAFKDGDLYVAEISKISKFSTIESNLEHPKMETVFDSLPTDAHHGWKYIAFGPDGKLYVPVGAPCNICHHPEDRRYASICRMNADGSAFEVFAEGIRNTVGFAWHPQTKELWFTDNGRDWMGDDAPNDELNRAYEKGLHFGYPFCHAGEILDPEFGEGKTCSEFQPPVQKLGAHVAALGMLFYTGEMFPAKYREGALICEHGSWNRSEPSGYRLSFVSLDGNRATEYTGLVEGFLENEKPWARPVALLQMPDGSVLFSDDLGGKVFRLSYSSPQ